MDAPPNPTCLGLFGEPDSVVAERVREVTKVVTRTRYVRRREPKKAPVILRSSGSGPDGDVFEGTVDEARVWLHERIGRGVTCPVCSQYAKVYRRKVTGSMARSLIGLARHSQSDEWFHLQQRLNDLRATKTSRDEAMLGYWRLIEEEVALRPDGGRSGWWRVTPLGRSFVAGQQCIFKYAYVYDSRLLHYDGPQVCIQEALGVKFNYAELMAGL